MREVYPVRSVLGQRSLSFAIDGRVVRSYLTVVDPDQVSAKEGEGVAAPDEAVSFLETMCLSISNPSQGGLLRVHVRDLDILHDDVGNTALKIQPFPAEHTRIPLADKCFVRLDPDAVHGRIIIRDCCHGVVATPPISVDGELAAFPRVPRRASVFGCRSLRADELERLR